MSLYFCPIQIQLLLKCLAVFTQNPATTATAPQSPITTPPPPKKKNILIIIKKTSTTHPNGQCHHNYNWAKSMQTRIVIPNRLLPYFFSIPPEFAHNGALTQPKLSAL